MTKLVAATFALIVLGTIALEAQAQTRCQWVNEWGKQVWVCR